MSKFDFLIDKYSKPLKNENTLEERVREHFLENIKTQISNENRQQKYLNNNNEFDSTTNLYMALLFETGMELPDGRGEPNFCTFRKPILDPNTYESYLKVNNFFHEIRRIDAT